MSAHREPTFGPSRALYDAPPDTPVDEIPQLLDDVERWRCTECGHERFARTGADGCGECGSSSFERYTPGGER